MKLYEQFLRPALKPYVTLIDGAANTALNKAQAAAQQIAGQAQGVVVSSLPEVLILQTNVLHHRSQGQEVVKNAAKNFAD